MSRSVENLNNSSSDNEREKESGAKGGLISEKISLSLKSPKMVAKVHIAEHIFFYLDSAQGSDLEPIFKELSQIEFVLTLSYL